MNNQMRVLHVYCGPFPTPQGTQTLIKQTCSLAANHNIDTHLICYHHGNRSDIPLPFSIHRISNFPRFKSERSGPALIKIPLDINFVHSLKKKIAVLQPNILHAHHYEALLVCKLADPQRKIPVIFHQHAAFGPELPTYSHRFFSSPLQHLGNYIDRTLPLLANRTIAVCQTNFEKLKKILPAEKATLLLPPAVDFPECCPRITNPKVTAVYMGNLDRYQNIDALLSATAQLKKKTTNNFILQIITDSVAPAHMVQRVEKLPWLETHPHISFERAWRLLCQADFAIIPRKIPGGIPIKLVNALAAGVPVIANPKVTPELFENEALLIDTSKASNIADAIDALVHSPQLREKLSQTSSEALQRLFRPEKYIEGLKDCYHHAIRR